MLMIDDFSRMMWVSFLREEYEYFEKLKDFKVIDKSKID